MIAFPLRARRAIAALFRPYNDIDVFVEDTVARNFYEVLIGRILGDRTRVTRVVQLGPRNAVISACASDQLPAARKRIYLIDGDLELVTGQPAPSLKHLYRLNVYASENLVYCRHAMGEVALECATNQSSSEIAAVLDLDAEIESLARILVPLFALYGAAHLLEPSIPTTGPSVMTLCTQMAGFPQLDPTKVHARADSIRSALGAVYGIEGVKAIEERLLASMGENHNALTRYVSGKSYLLPLLFHQLERVVGYAGTIEQLKVRLARFADLDLDDGLAHAVRDCSRGVAS